MSDERLKEILREMARRIMELETEVKMLKQALFDKSDSEFGRYK
jgi:hypothetical protein